MCRDGGHRQESWTSTANQFRIRSSNQKDMDRTLVLDQRTQLVARKITEFLKATNRFNKTIVFCEDIDHASRMRTALANENADLVAQNSKYVMQITGDNAEGKAELDQFIHPEEKYPVIATTSELMTTGVDAKTCKLIVLDKRIQSMTKFKQIIGRGTRIDEDHDKLYFTIMDFKKATELFADPEFDGEPVQIYKPGPEDPPLPPDDGDSGDQPEDATGTSSAKVAAMALTPERQEPVLRADSPVEASRERSMSLMTCRSLCWQNEFSTTAPMASSSPNHSRTTLARKSTPSTRRWMRFLQKWSSADQKEAILSELEERGVLFAELADQVGKDFDPFDLVCHVAFDQPPLTRRERAENVRKRNYFTKYGDQARAVLEALLEKYADEGIETIEDPSVLKVQPIDKFGTPVEIIRLFGGAEAYQTAVKELESALYAKVG